MTFAVSCQAWLRACALIILFVARAAHATAIQMDEAEYQPVDGLHIADVTFHFSIDGSPSDDAFIDAFAVGDLSYINDPSLEGNTSGILRMDFDQAVDHVSFGLALQSELPQDRAISVTLYGSQGDIVTQQWLDARPLVVFAEAHGDYSGAGITAVAIGFAQPASRFALDNVSYAISSVPEPASAPLALMGAVMLLARQAVRRRL